ISTPSNLFCAGFKIYIWLIIYVDYFQLCSKLSWEINEKEIRIENTAPFGVSFTKCLIDHHPVMPCCHSKFHPSCRTHQTRM
ncbi:hypothetical protein ZWY2020_059811, partial [Hordeum vulgare]